MLLCGGSLGVLTAFAVRGGATPKLRYTVGTAIGTALIMAAALVIFLPPRGQIDAPQYYAFGPDIPRALSAVEAAQRGSRALDQELNAQLVGLARLVTAPGNRPALEDRPRFTLASDLHNNIVAIPILERTAAKGPVFFPGDLTDRGSPVEASVVSRVIKTGSPFVFVPGNHDSDQLANRLARDGAIVLTRTGRLDGHGRDVRRADREDQGDPGGGLRRPVRAQRRRGLRGHLPEARPSGDRALRDLAAAAPRRRRHRDGPQPRAAARRPQGARRRKTAPSRSSSWSATPTTRSSPARAGATIINAGTVGAGGTGNLKEHSKVGIARITYETTPSFAPLAVDLVEIDPGSGNATARRERLDESPLP